MPRAMRAQSNDIGRTLPSDGLPGESTIVTSIAMREFSREIININFNE